MFAFKSKAQALPHFERFEVYAWRLAIQAEQEAARSSDMSNPERRQDLNDFADDVARLLAVARGGCSTLPSLAGGRLKRPPMLFSRHRAD